MCERTGKLLYDMWCEALRGCAAADDGHQVRSPEAWPFLSEPERQAWALLAEQAGVRFFTPAAAPAYEWGGAPA